jgi:predicted RNase H-like HicB family nuclease
MVKPGSGRTYLACRSTSKRYTTQWVSAWRQLRGYTADGELGWRSTVKLTAVFQKVPEGYIGFVEELPGANTQGATLEEAREALVEAVDLVLEANRALSEESIQGKEVIREPLIVTAE